MWSGIRSALYEAIASQRENEMEHEGALIVKDLQHVRELVMGITNPDPSNYHRLLAQADESMNLLRSHGVPIHCNLTLRRERAKTAATTAFRTNTPDFVERGQVSDAFELLRNELCILAKNAKPILVRKLRELAADFYILGPECADSISALRDVDFSIEVKPRGRTRAYELDDKDWVRRYFEAS
jgi:hypothetical protein